MFCKNVQSCRYNNVVYESEKQYSAALSIYIYTETFVAIFKSIIFVFACIGDCKYG